ncbi:thioredoxin [Brevibacillus ginsengisoli]|uniref:thioredoxin n=1 Tax=Brevibacillus ginsengisoli TaxID=363854 RepID=UPI003CF1488E
MAILNTTDQNFAQEVEQGGGTVLVDFWAPWCGPCKMIAPVLEQIDSEIGNKLKIVKVNVDDNPDSAGRFGIMSIPTLLLFKDGQPVDKIVGFQPKEALLSTINKHL